jgi:type II restriction/modification system DNA methylase subunit YeeA
VDFTGLTEAQASCYELPFQHLQATVKPERSASEVKNERDRAWLIENWWLFWRPRPELAQARAKYSRVIVVPEVSKHRVFVWVDSVVGIDKNLIAIARDDYLTFGTLQSTLHVAWSLRLGTSLEDRPRYTPSTAFDTFPFPDGLTPDLDAQTFQANSRAKRIEAAARVLDQLRSEWLNPAELVERVAELGTGYSARIRPRSKEAEKVLAKRTLTNLYNQNPPWLQHAHTELDAAVAAAYGWNWPLSDDELLQCLFKLNQERT